MKNSKKRIAIHETEYSENLQTKKPSYCFQDSDLRKCSLSMTKSGIMTFPEKYSGANAVVFKLKSKSGDKAWAVRCFYKIEEATFRRYKQLSTYLTGKKDKLPFLASFEFLNKGIQFQDIWYPILKMEWIEGRNLEDYLKDNYSNQGRIRTLKNRWADIIRTLRDHEIAHGDLQHGNILVLPDHSIRLVDYDGCFIPDFQGLSIGECGHEDYAHPDRKKRNLFNLQIDRFPAWVIYLSLHIIEEDPKIYKDRGQLKIEERILFSGTDYKYPKNSKLMERLEGHSSSEIRNARKCIRVLAQSSFENTPPLPDGTIELGRFALGEPSSSLPSWLRNDNDKTATKPLKKKPPAPNDKAEEDEKTQPAEPRKSKEISEPTGDAIGDAIGAAIFGVILFGIGIAIFVAIVDEIELAIIGGAIGAAIEAAIGAAILGAIFGAIGFVVIRMENGFVFLGAILGAIGVAIFSAIEESIWAGIWTAICFAIAFVSGAVSRAACESAIFGTIFGAIFGAIGVAISGAIGFAIFG